MLQITRMVTLASTRKSREEIYLLGTYNEDIKGCKLPSNRQTLRHFFHLHFNKGERLHNAGTNTANKVISFWSKARISTRHKQNCIKQVELIELGDPLLFVPTKTYLLQF